MAAHQFTVGLLNGGGRMRETKIQEYNNVTNARTVRLRLTQEERKIFVDILDTCLSDLRMEIGHTDRQDFRDTLKQRKKVLVKVLEKIL
jgi:hypothetical protein